MVDIVVEAQWSRLECIAAEQKLVDIVVEAQWSSD